MPLDLFRNRSYAVTILATFLAAIGFFGAIIFLPRWFQFVKGVSPTDPGCRRSRCSRASSSARSSPASSSRRTGRYKWIVIGALAMMSLGMFLLTGLTSRTDLPVMWAWMFITGLGIGPTLSVFTIVIQSVVPFDRLGVATGNLTFFRQVGGSVGLAIVGTLFAAELRLATRALDGGRRRPSGGRRHGRELRQQRCRRGHHPGRRRQPRRPALAGAGAPGFRRRHRQRHPRGVLARDRGHVLVRARDDRHRARGGRGRPARGPASGLFADAGGRRRSGRRGQSAPKGRVAASPRPRCSPRTRPEGSA